MNSLEVSRIAGFCTDYCKNFLGRIPITPPMSILLCQDMGWIELTECKPLHVHWALFYTQETLLCIYCLILRLCDFFFCFSLSWEKLGEKCAPPHFSSPSYATVCSTVATENVITTGNLTYYIKNYHFKNWGKMCPPPPHFSSPS